MAVMKVRRDTRGAHFINPELIESMVVEQSPRNEWVVTIRMISNTHYYYDVESEAEGLAYIRSWSSV